MKKAPMFDDPSKMLDYSNYLYGAAALLTLFATFGVIYFGRAATKLKEAQVKQYQIAADQRIAEANSKAAVAYNQAAQAEKVAQEARTHALELERNNLLLQERLSGTEDKVTAIEANTAFRVFTPHDGDEAALLPYKGRSVGLESIAGDQESSSLARTLGTYLGRYLACTASQVMGPGPLTPLSKEGLHIVALPTPGGRSLGSTIKQVLEDGGLHPDIKFATPPETEMLRNHTRASGYFEVLISVSSKPRGSL